MRLAKLCLAATLLQVSTPALAGELSHSTPQQAFAALGTSRDPAVIYKEAVSQGWTVSRANSGGLNLSGRLTDGTYVFNRLDPGDYWKPNTNLTQGGDASQLKGFENHEHWVSVPGTSTSVLSNADGTIDFKNRGADVTRYWLTQDRDGNNIIAPTTDGWESHMPIDGNPADIEIPNFVLNGSSYDTPPANPNNLPVPVGKPFGPDNPSGERPFYPPVPTDPNANLPVPVEKPPANSATNQTPPETPPSSGLRQGARSVAEGTLVNAFTTYWTCIQANPDQRTQCAKASGISTAIGAGCSTAQEATGSATVGFACNALIGYKACVLSGRDPNQCLADWQSGIPAAAFCAAVGLLNVAAGMICGAVAPSGFEAGAAILDAGDAERINRVLGPIVDRALTCEFGAALTMATRDFTNPPRGLPTVDEKLLRILAADQLAERNVQKLLGQAQGATDPQQRQTLLNQALAAAGTIRCLRQRVIAVMPPAQPPTPPSPPSQSTNATCPYEPAPVCQATLQGNTSIPKVCEHANNAAAAKPVCILADPDSIALSKKDCENFGGTFRLLSDREYLALTGLPQYYRLPPGLGGGSSGGLTLASSGYCPPQPPSATHADVAMLKPPPDIIDTPAKPTTTPPPDVIDTPAPPTHGPTDQQAALPGPTPEPTPNGGSSGSGTQPQINIYTGPPTQPGPVHTPPQGTSTPPVHPPQGTSTPPIGTGTSPGPGVGRENGGTCTSANGITTCVDEGGHKCMTKADFCDPTAPPPLPPKTVTPQKPAPLPPKTVTPTQPAPLPPKTVSPQAPKPLPPVAVAPRATPQPVPPPAPPPPSLPQQTASVEPPPVQPACSKEKQHFVIDYNEPVTVAETSVGGAPCLNAISPGKEHITSINISSQPGNGTATRTGELATTYRPRPGFKGSDTYSINICGESDTGSGCSVITYRVTVE